MYSCSDVQILAITEKKTEIFFKKFWVVSLKIPPKNARLLKNHLINNFSTAISLCITCYLFTPLRTGERLP